MAGMVSDELADRVSLLQRRIVDEGRQVLVVFEGRSGRVMGRVINEFQNLLEPRSILYSHFTPERTVGPRDFMRFISREPALGEIGIYDRSWYSWVVHRANSGIDVDDDIGNIIDTERYFTNNGVILVKIYLNMSDTLLEGLGKEYGSKKKGAGAESFLTDDHIDSKEWREKLIMPLIAKTSTVFAPWDIVEVSTLGETMHTVLQTFLIRVNHALESGVARQLPPKGPIYANPRLSEDLTKKAKNYKADLEKYSERLATLQMKLANTGRSLVLVFEGWDAAGKGGSIRRVTRALNPRGYYVQPVAAPSGAERLHTYLWRFTYNMPKAGHITIYDRSWYGRMMVEPIEGFCTEEEYERSAAEIRSFERMVSESGAIIIKFWMEISPDEQLSRFNARQEDPLKTWKITDEDWRNREKWDVYSEYVDRMMESTNTPYAPWVVVESEDKKYGRIKVLKTIVEALESQLD